MNQTNRSLSIRRSVVLLGLLWHCANGAGDPVLVGQWPGYRRYPGENHQVTIDGNHAYVAAADLEVYDISNLAQPFLVGWYGVGIFGTSGGVAVSDGYAYVAVAPGLDWTNDFEGMLVLDVHDPAHPRRVGGYPVVHGASGIAITGHYACVLGKLLAGTASLLVLDIQNPAQPQKVGQRSLSGQAIVASGDYAYVVVGNGVVIVDISQPAAPQLVGSCALSWQPTAIALSGRYAYVSGFTANGMAVIDVGTPTKPQVVGRLSQAAVHGYALAVMSGVAYLANDMGLALVNVADPANPLFLGTYGVAELGLRNARAIAASGFSVFVGADGLRVLDVGDPANPQLAGSAPEGQTKDLALSGHYTYLADGRAGLQVLDVSNRAQPVRVAQWTSPDSAEALVVRGDWAYVADGRAGLQIVDISAPSNPRWVGERFDINSAGFAWGLAVAGNYAYVVSSGGFNAIDISDPFNPQWVGRLQTRAITNGAPRGVAVYGNWAFVSASGKGLLVIDIHDPTNPQIAGGFDLGISSVTYGITTSGNYAYLAADGNGLNIFDVRDPTRPQLVGAYAGGAVIGPMLPYVQNALIAGNYAYLAGFGLKIVDVSNPTQPQYVGGVVPSSLNGFVSTASCAVDSDAKWAYAAAGGDGLLTLDLHPPPPRFLPSTRVDAQGSHVFLTGPTGQSARVQRSQDLKTWQTRRTIILTGEVDEVLDQTAADATGWFYRVVAP